MKRVIIVGASGQDGRILADRLREESVLFLGLSRAGVFGSQGEISPAVCLDDPVAIAGMVQSFKPTHIFYLAAYHHSAQDQIAVSAAELWHSSLTVHLHGLVNFLEAMRFHAPTARLFYASSSLVFGSASEFPQNETTRFAPENVYGITKLAGQEACRLYRNDLHVSVGILYNHESVYRSEKFLSKKIVTGALAIKAGHQQQLILGDLSSETDWGYAPDYIEAMLRITDRPEPEDYVIATGKTHTVRQFVEAVFEELHLDPTRFVTEDPALIHRHKSRLAGDTRRLREATAWEPSVSFEEMARLITRQCTAKP